MHHWTGRDWKDCYYHAEFVVAMLLRAHVAVHSCLRANGLDALPPGVEVLTYLRRRMAFQFVLWADQGETVTLSPCDLRVLARLLDKGEIS